MCTFMSVLIWLCFDCLYAIAFWCSVFVETFREIKLILKYFLYLKVATGGADGILLPTLVDQMNALHEAMASVAAEPKSEEKEEHILENFHSSRIIRKLVLDCSAFASTLWKMALSGKCEVWAKGHRLEYITLCTL